MNGLLYPDASHVGKRVSITGYGRGTLAYAGSAAFHSDDSMWYGIVLDGPSGKHNGTVQDQRYFVCDDNCGILLQASSKRVAMIDGGDITALAEEMRLEEAKAARGPKKQYAKSRRNLKALKRQQELEHEKKLRHEHVRNIMAEVSQRDSGIMWSSSLGGPLNFNACSIASAAAGSGAPCQAAGQR